MKQIYLDNGATTFPKPEAVVKSMVQYMSSVGGNVNRSSHSKSFQAENIVFETRELLCQLFNYDRAENVVFTNNITSSLNIVLKGLLKPGDHIIVSSMEHNAVMRPLNGLSKTGVTYSTVPCNSQGELNPQDIYSYIKPNTKAIIMTHSSNVCGTILPYKEIGRLCKEKNLIFIADTAQTAGCVSIDMKEMNIDILCFTGHKSLLGPQGIGGFIIDNNLVKEVSPLIEGGTGSLSEYEVQPEYMPDKFEAGTLNIPGIYGLNAALKFILQRGIDNISSHEMKLTEYFLEGVNKINEVNIIGKEHCKNRTAVVSLDFFNFDNGEVAYLLSKNYGISTRCGLHCAPSAHKTLGTFPKGTVRFSFGLYNSMEEVDYTISSIMSCVKELNKNNEVFNKNIT